MADNIIGLIYFVADAEYKYLANLLFTDSEAIAIRASSDNMAVLKSVLSEDAVSAYQTASNPGVDWNPNADALLGGLGRNKVAQLTESNEFVWEGIKRSMAGKKNVAYYSDKVTLDLSALKVDRRLPYTNLNVPNRRLPYDKLNEVLIRKHRLDQDYDMTFLYGVFSGIFPASFILNGSSVNDVVDLLKKTPLAARLKLL